MPCRSICRSRVHNSRAEQAGGGARSARRHRRRLHGEPASTASPARARRSVFWAIAAALAQRQTGARADAGDRAHQPVHRPLRAPLRREAGGVALGRSGAPARPQYGGPSQRIRRSLWSAHVPRCSCPSPSSASSSSMRSTTRATSKRSASSIRRATWRWCAARSAVSRWCLSSATPSIESLVNAEQGRYRHIRLATRYKAAGLPAIAAIDMRAITAGARHAGCRRFWSTRSQALSARGEQALLFLESARLCAGHALPEMRLQIRMPELLGVAGRAQVPPPPRVSPLRQVRADP